MPKHLLLMRAGIIDPTKVGWVALQHAASIAALMLTSEALITDVQDQQAAMLHGSEDF
jgi:chaperonin GroEL